MNLIEPTTEPIYGWRYFRDIRSASVGIRDYTNIVEPLLALPEDIKLIGDSTYWVIWKDSYMEAECMEAPFPLRKEILKDHLSTGKCACGIYLKPTLEDIQAYGKVSGTYTYPRVYAYCKGWGLCVEGRAGLRCQYVQVLALSSDSEVFIGKKFWGIEVMPF